jgi:hypothetical protein
VFVDAGNVTRRQRRRQRSANASDQQKNPVQLVATSVVESQAPPNFFQILLRKVSMPHLLLLHFFSFINAGMKLQGNYVEWWAQNLFSRFTFGMFLVLIMQMVWCNRGSSSWSHCRCCSGDCLVPD